MKKYEMTRKNYTGLVTFALLLLLGFIGRMAAQEWAENIYTMLTIIWLILCIYMVVIKTQFRPIRAFLVAFGIHILFSAAAGWWWLSMYWIAILCLSATCMTNFIAAQKVQGED